MIVNDIGLTEDSYSNIYTADGSEIGTIYDREGRVIYYMYRDTIGDGFRVFTSYGAPIKDYKIYGDTIQNGIPSPDMPVDVVGCGVRTGNLWNEDYIGINTDATYRPLFVGDGVFTLSTDFERNGNITDIFLLSGNVSSGISPDANGAYQGRNITARSVDGYITIAYRANARTGSDSLPYCKTMLSAGSTALPYEPYGYKLPVTTTNRTDTVTTSIYVGSESLHRIDKYADYVDYSSGKTVRRIKKLVLTGEENWRLYALPGAVNVERFYFVLSQFAVSASPDTQVSSHFPIKSNNRDMEHMRIGGSSNDEMYIYIPRLLATTVAGLKSYLAAQYAAGTPVTVWYVPATPIEEDPPVLFPELPTLSGTNTLTVDTTVKPSEIDLTGRIRTSGYGQLLDVNDVAIQDKNSTPIFIHG